MRSLVTGGAGFIGSHLVDALLAEGHDVAVVDDLSRGRRAQVHPAARLHVVDVRDAALHDVLRQERPEVVFHQAAQIDVRRSISEPLLDTEINVVGTVNLLQACVGAGVRRVVFASSGGAIYGDTTRIPTPEEHPAMPASLYGAAKLCGEAYGGVYSGLYGLEFVAMRYANVYGPRQDPHGEAGVVAIFARKLLADEAPVINGEGTQTRDYVYVGDAVRAFLAAGDSGRPGTWNIGTGVEVSVLDLVAIIGVVVGRDVRPVFAGPRPGELQRSAVATERAASELGWRAAIPLGEGVRRVYQWIESGAPDRVPC